MEQLRGFSMPNQRSQRAGMTQRLRRDENPVTSFGGGSDFEADPDLNVRMAGQVWQDKPFNRQAQATPKDQDDWMSKFSTSPDGASWFGVDDEASSSNPQ